MLLLLLFHGAYVFLVTAAAQEVHRRLQAD
jgi:hypothetical protein